MYYITIIIWAYKVFSQIERQSVSTDKKSQGYLIDLDFHIYLKPSKFTCSNFQNSSLSQSMSYVKRGKAVNSIYIVILQLVGLNFGSDFHIY